MQHRERKAYNTILGRHKLECLHLPPVNMPTPSEMPENKAVCVKWIMFSDEAFYAFPIGKINHLPILPDYEQTSRVWKIRMVPNLSNR